MSGWTPGSTDGDRMKKCTIFVHCIQLLKILQCAFSGDSPKIGRKAPVSLRLSAESHKNYIFMLWNYNIKIQFIT